METPPPTGPPTASPGCPLPRAIVSFVQDAGPWTADSVGSAPDDVRPSDSDPSPDADVAARLARLAAARGPLRRALARLAGRLVETGAIERLTYARLGDYARERLGLSPRKLQELARTDRLLAGLPSLDASLRRNLLPWCKVRMIARIATPETVDDWIERARAISTRVLEAAVLEAARGTALEPELAAEDPDRHRWIRLRCSPRVRAKWSVVRELAECAAGQRLGDGEALEWVAAEAFSTFSIDPDLVRSEDSPLEPDRRKQAGFDPSPPREGSDGADGAEGASGEPNGAIPVEMTPVDPVEEEWEEVAVLLRDLEDADAFDLDCRLRRAVHLEQVLDATLAPLLRGVRDGCEGGEGEPGEPGEPGSSPPEWRRTRSPLSASACEALGMSARKVRALLRIERAGDVCPELRGAYRDGRLSWVKAQCLLPLLVLDRHDDPRSDLPAGSPDEPPDATPTGRSDAAPEARFEGAYDAASVDTSVDTRDGGEWRAAWVAWAQRVTVRRLTEDVERALLLRAMQGRVWRQRRDHPETALDPIPAGERQLCAPGVDPEATERLAWWVPVEVALLFTGVRETLRRRLEAEAHPEVEPEPKPKSESHNNKPVTDNEVFEALLDEALRAWTLWEPGVRRPNPVIERDGYRCAVPGCSSRRNLQDHHIVFRSRGGCHAPWNRVTLCAFHHLRGVHTGRLRVEGHAPERLVFELGLRDGEARSDRDERYEHEGRPALVAYRSGDVVMAC